MRRSFTTLMTLTGALVLAGCYSFSPLESQPGPGQETRVRLTELGTAVMGPAIGSGVVALRGRILSVDTANVTISVVSVTNRNDLEEPWVGERVTIARQHVAGFDRRDLSKTRSVLLAGGVLFGATALFGAVAIGGGDVGRLFGVNTKH